MFKTKAGIEIPGISSTNLIAIREELFSEYGITKAQYVEACSYSMAVVVRFALGLSALGGRVACIFDDTLTGLIAVATVRHLINAGSEAELLFIGDLEKASSDLELQLKPLERMGQSLTLWNSEEDNHHITSILQSCHNSLCGYYKLGSQPSAFEYSANELLNDLTTPIYAIESPPGVDPDSGKRHGSALYASCTLSLGAPLQGLFEGADYVGRHYVCDTSITKELYAKAGMDLTQVFADQPVQQIFPLKSE